MCIRDRVCASDVVRPDIRPYREIVGHFFPVPFCCGCRRCLKIRGTDYKRFVASVIRPSVPKFVKSRITLFEIRVIIKGTVYFIHRVRCVGVRIKRDVYKRQPDIIVKTDAIMDTNPELVYAKEHNIPVYRRAELLGYIRCV